MLSLREAPVAVEHVVKRYGAITALDDASLDVPAGEITGLLGPNGAGKTTLLRILTGLSRPDSGRASLFGMPCANPSARASLGFLPEVVNFPAGPTTSEFLLLHAALAGVPASESTSRVRTLAERVGIGAVLHQRAATLSKGMRRRVGLAHALLAQPGVLLLDEPSADLDPVARRELETLLVEERARGCAILISSHLLLEMEPLATRVVMLHRGKVLADGVVAALLPTRHLVEIVMPDFPPILRDATAHLLPVFHAKEGRLTFSTNDPELAAELRRLLEKLGVACDSITTRRPNLRDLFFALLEGARD
ncbi:MAG: ABC transporter ATP-binding protein [bacterium]